MKGIIAKQGGIGVKIKINISAIEIIDSTLTEVPILSKAEEGMALPAPRVLHMGEGITIAYPVLIDQIMRTTMMVCIGEIIIVVEEGERVLEGVVLHIRATTRRDNLIEVTITSTPV